ncbi:uncharacterized protein (DUF1501 family) [Rhodoferax ferrireducens]|uniref:Uncharacterized protein (DUF1501 family) n=1 Tax=Rhodoferax ferrireducens TaxID=192843 RepID=A0ABU2C369_9BURK|nr:DUF1501 domain-containing protein [Rhodoferax ferrireducens]MDR7375771.1 uncharacterized protein (DUF1501 family) [Rhodoferax ferrireducens]
MQRRHLLQSLTALPLLNAGQLFAAPAAQSRLLFVFLRGAYDAANLLVPTSSDFYYASRPDIAVPRPGADLNSAIALNADWGLHPALRDTVYPLFQKGEASFIPFAGTDDVSRSHFETQDSIELGQPLTGPKNYRSGFMNRLASVINGAEPMAFTDSLPLVMQGSVQVPNTALKSLAKPAVDPRQTAIIAAMYKGTELSSRVTDGFAVRDEVARELSSEMMAASRGAINAKGFELEAQRIARLMKERYNLGFVDVGGWDTHVNQGGASGYLASRLEELGRGLATFAQEMGPAWRNTTVVVASEFGRTFRQNGNRGTDHGHGSVYWVLGGGLHGGKIAGEQQKVEQASLFQNRDYPVLNEYRAVMGGLFARQFGLNSKQLEQVFAGVKPIDIRLV